MIDAVFKIDKLFSEFDVSNKTSGLTENNSISTKTSVGILYVEWDILTSDKLNQHIYYEGSGWYPVEIVRNYYDQHNFNPRILSYASATETFNVNFDNFTNDQFRTFLGKCTSKSYDDVWRTKDYLEFMRARYILRDHITSFKFDNGCYQIIYKSEQNPWNVPVIAVYVKAHQKYNIFKQYNKLIDNNITPVAITVDGIEVQEKCDHLFDLGKEKGAWKIESIFTNGSSEPSVIERDIPKPRGEVEFKPDSIVPRFLHISGACGNGKSQFIIELAKIYPSIMFMTPTNDSAKNLLDRAKQLRLTLNIN